MANPEALALAEAALRVARRRAKLLDRMKAALLEGDTEEVLHLARVLTGLEEDEMEEVGAWWRGPIVVWMNLGGATSSWCIALSTCLKLGTAT